MIVAAPRQTLIGPLQVVEKRRGVSVFLAGLAIHAAALAALLPQWRPTEAAQACSRSTTHPLHNNPGRTAPKPSHPWHANATEPRPAS
jgi:hypothetical protein